MLNTRTTLNLFLILLVAVLGAILYFRPGVVEHVDEIPLTTLDPVQIKRLEIIREGHVPINLVRTLKGWQIQAPFMIPANSVRVETLLRLATTSSLARFGVESRNLEAYDLDHRHLVVKLDDIEIVFGGNEPLNNRRYVRIGSQIHVINDSFYYQAQADLASYVALEILPPEVMIEKISLPGLTLQRDEQQRWHADSTKTEMSADDITAVVTAWQHAQAMRVSGYKHEDRVIDKVVLTIQQQPLRIEFELLASTSEIILGRKDIAMRYHLAEEQAIQMHLPIGQIKPAADTAHIPGD